MDPNKIDFSAYDHLRNALNPKQMYIDHNPKKLPDDLMRFLFDLGHFIDKKYHTNDKLNEEIEARIDLAREEGYEQGYSEGYDEALAEMEDRDCSI